MTTPSLEAEALADAFKALGLDLPAGAIPTSWPPEIERVRQALLAAEQRGLRKGLEDAAKLAWQEGNEWAECPGTTSPEWHHFDDLAKRIRALAKEVK